MGKLVPLLLVLAAAARAAAFYAEDGPVAKLTGADIVSGGRVADDTYAVWAVEFYAPWCGQCQAFAPEFTLAAEKLRGIVHFGAVDCDAEENKQACAQAGVRSFPTVHVYPWFAQRNPYKPREAPAKTPRVYGGRPAAKPLSDFATAELPRQFIANVSGVQAAPAADEAPLVLLFTDKADAPPLYRALSLQFRNRLRFAQARAADTDLAAQFGVTSAPALVLQLASGELVRYDGALKAAALSEFLGQHAAPLPPPPPEEAAQPAPGGAPALPRALHNASQLSEAVLAKEPAALVAFLGGAAECAPQWEAWRAAARALDGQVITAEANATADWAAPYVGGAPGACVAVARWPFGDKADADVELYDGALESRALGAWALEWLPDFVRAITADTAQAYFNLEARMPKLILVTAKPETPLMYRALAANFHGRLQFAVTRDTDPLAATLRVERAPGVKAMLVPPGSEPTPDGALPLMLQDYVGPLRYYALAIFCEMLTAHVAGTPGPQNVASEMAQPREVLQVTDDAGLRTACEGRSSLCVLAFLDGRAAALPTQQAVLRTAAADQDAHVPVQFAWVDMARYAAVAAAFDVFSAPAAVVLSARKLRYAPLRTSFGASALSSLIKDVLAGRATTAPLTALPPVVESTPDAASDAAAAEDVAEDEFDLSEIMDVRVDAASKEELLRQAEQSVLAEAEARAAAQAAAKAEAAEATQRPKLKKKKSAKKGASQAEL